MQSVNVASQRGINIYKSQQVMHAAPGQLLLQLHDFVIEACVAHDKERALRGLTEMVDSLNFEAGIVAFGLLRLHQYSIEQLHKGNFEGVRYVVGGLRDAWATAIKQSDEHSLVFQDRAIAS